MTSKEERSMQLFYFISSTLSKRGFFTNLPLTLGFALATNFLPIKPLFIGCFALHFCFFSLYF